MARSVAINARHMLPSADKARWDFLTASTARQTEKQTAKDEMSRRNYPSTLYDLMHLTRIRLQLAIYFCLHEGSLPETESLSASGWLLAKAVVRVQDDLPRARSIPWSAAKLVINSCSQLRHQCPRSERRNERTLRRPHRSHSRYA
jgi:hypothetical protein